MSTSEGYPCSDAIVKPLSKMKFLKIYSLDKKTCGFGVGNTKRGVNQYSLAISTF